MFDACNRRPFAILSSRRLGSCIAGALLAVGTPAIAQVFSTGFEPTTYVGTPQGFPLIGQDGWFIPAVAGSIDAAVYAYDDNALLMPANPDGGLQFLGGTSGGGTSFARSQHEGMNLPNVIIISYDCAAGFVGTAPTAQNLGSFSLQPEPNTAAPSIRTYIQLNTWVDINNPTAWSISFLPYNATGGQFAQPGAYPSASWQNLVLNHWYRVRTTIDFTQNRITHVSLTDIAAGVTDDVDPVDWFVGGGQNSVLPIPQGVRFFSGGGLGNVMAWDNLSITEPPQPCPCDWNNDHTLNSQDFFDFLTDFFKNNGDFNGDGMTNSQDFFDFITCFFTGCP